MDRKRNSLVPIAEVFGGLDGPPNALREASSQAVHHFTRFDQVNQLVGPEAQTPSLFSVSASSSHHFATLS